MKIRIEDNSVRYRLRKSEVAALAKEGLLTGVTQFPGSRLEYVLRASPSAGDLKASYSEGKITIEIPGALVREWPDTPRVGFEAYLPVGGARLHLLIEKDFACLDRSPGSQTDQYPNPKETP